MGYADESIDAAEEQRGREADDWVDRVANASSDFEAVGPEVAADLGL